MRNVLVTVDKESVSVIFGRDKQILRFQCRTSSCLRTGKETGDDYTQATASKLSVIQVHDNNNMQFPFTKYVCYSTCKAKAFAISLSVMGAFSFMAFLSASRLLKNKFLKRKCTPL